MSGAGRAERLTNGVLKFTDRDGSELTVAAWPAGPVLRLGIRENLVRPPALGLVDLTAADVEDLRDELDAWLARHGRNEAAVAACGDEDAWSAAACLLAPGHDGWHEGIGNRWAPAPDRTA